jgi:hypothetical protein
MRRLFKREPSVLDEPIEKILTEMNTYKPDDPEWPMLIEHLDKLTRMKSDYRNRRFSPDTMLLVAGNLLGILVIVAYEQKHVMVSKGLGFVIKPKEPRI